VHLNYSCSKHLSWLSSCSTRNNKYTETKCNSNYSTTIFNTWSLHMCQFMIIHLLHLSCIYNVSPIFPTVRKTFSIRILWPDCADSSIIAKQRRETLTLWIALQTHYNDMPFYLTAIMIFINCKTIITIHWSEKR